MFRRAFSANDADGAGDAAHAGIIPITTGDRK
jgi:hypothetical protein